MALVYVGGTTGIAAGGTANWTVSLTSLTGGIASSPSIGDVVVLFTAAGYAAGTSYQGGATNYTWITGTQGSGSTSVARIDVSYKVLTAADTSISVYGSQDTKAASAAAVQVWRNVSTDTPPYEAVSSSNLASGTGTGRPNPGAKTPVTSGAVIVVGGAAASGAGAVFTSSDLTDFLSATSPDTTDAMIGSGYYEWTSGAFDAAQFGGGTTGAGDAWSAVTLVLKPAPPPTFPATGTSFTRTGFPATFTIRPIKFPAQGRSLTFSGYAARFMPYRLFAESGAFVVAGGSASVSLKKTTPSALITAQSPVSSELYGVNVVISENGLTLVALRTSNTYLDVYRRTPGTLTWAYDTSLTHYSGTTIDLISLSGDGDTVVYVCGGNYKVCYKRVSGTWTAKTLSLTQSNPRTSLSYDGNTLCCADAYITGANPIHIWTYNGTSWSNTGVSLQGSLFYAGVSTSVNPTITHDGLRILTVDQRSTSSAYPRIYEFTNSGGTWSETASFDAVSVANTHTGNLFSKDGNTIVSLQVQYGSAFTTVYSKKKVAGTWGSYSSLSVSSSTTLSVSSAGTNIFAGNKTENSSNGVVRKFTYVGTAFGQTYTFEPTYSGAEFCNQIGTAQDGNIVAGGIPRYDFSTYTDAGGVIIYAPPLLSISATTTLSLFAPDTLLRKDAANSYLSLASFGLSLTAPEVALTYASASTDTWFEALPETLTLSAFGIRSHDTRIGQFKTTASPATLIVRRLAAAPATLTLTFPAAVVVNIALDYIAVERQFITETTPDALELNGGTTLATVAFRHYFASPSQSVDIYTRNADGTYSFQEMETSSDGVSSFAVDYGGSPIIALSEDGNHMLVGAYEADGIGAVYYFSRSGGVWTQQQKIASPVGFLGTSYPSFGSAVRISADGTTAIIGDLRYGSATQAGMGRMYVYVRSGSVWSLQDTYTGVGGGVNATINGIALSDDGNTAVLTSNYSSSYTVVRDRVAGVWSTSTYTLRRAKAIEISGNGLVLLIQDYTTLIWYVYTRSGNTWTNKASIDVTPAYSFGAISADGELISLSTITSAEDGYDGCVSLFKKVAADFSVYAQVARYVLPDGVANTRHIQSRDMRYGMIGRRAFEFLKLKRINAVSRDFYVTWGATVFNTVRNAASSNFAAVGAPTLLLRGPMFSSEARQVVISGSSALVAWKRKASVSYGSFVLVPQPAFMLRVKGYVDSTPLAIDISWAQASTVRKLYCFADSSNISIASPAATVARIFTLRANHNEFANTFVNTTCNVKALLGGGNFHTFAFDPSAIHFRTILARPGAFNLSIVRAALRSPKYPAISVSVNNKAIPIIESAESIYASR